jgi:predicted DNA binding CopG/RHH family protein
MKKKLPRLNSDEAAEKFISTADLSEYDLSGMEMVRFEFQPKTERVNMRLPRPLLDAVKASAAKAGVPYQRFIRQALETAVMTPVQERLSQPLKLKTGGKVVYGPNDPKPLTDRQRRSINAKPGR